MTKFKVILLTLALLPSFNAQSGELTQYVTTGNAVKAAATIGAVYGAYKVYQAHCTKKAKQGAEIQEGLIINNKLIKAFYIDKTRVLDSNRRRHEIEIATRFEINKNTVIAFDLHDVIAKYNILKMMWKSISSPLTALSSVLYPGMFKIIAQQVKLGASAQQIFEAVKAAYPGNKGIEKIAALAIDISAQLKPIQGTIDIATRLMDNGYKVIFVSNIEPALWDRFVQDFPQFENCEHYLSTPENGWVKKPSEDYFKLVRSDLVKKAVLFNPLDFDNAADVRSYANDSSKKLNVLFIDDRVKNLVSAISQGIPSYYFTTPAQLETDLAMMRADLN